MRLSSRALMMLGIPFAAALAQGKLVAPIKLDSVKLTSFLEPFAKPTCTLPVTTEPLLVNVPGPVLDHLEHMRNSPFVQAYLIALIADPKAGHHRLSECARQFITPDGPSVTMRRLYQRYPDPSEIIKELRDARANLQAIGILGSGPMSLAVIADKVLGDSLAAPAAASLSFDSAFVTACTVNSTQPVCVALKKAKTAADDVARTRLAATVIADTIRRLSERKATFALNLTEEIRGAAADSNLLKASPAPTPGPGQDSLQALLARRDTTIANLMFVDGAYKDSIANAESRRADRNSDRDEAQRRAMAAIAALKAVPIAGIVVNMTIATSEGADTRVAEVAEGTDVPASNPRASTDNTILAVTDFIISRARREAVNSFIINLYAVASRDRLIQTLFADSWNLMSHIGTRGNDLDAIEVGRIPVSVWRATLASDFVNLPVRLIGDSTASICKPGSGIETPVQREHRLRCESRLATLRPIALATRRLLQGEGALNILPESLHVASAKSASTENRLFMQGLAMAGYLSRAFSAQGDIRKASFTKQPYVLSMEALESAPESQLAALARLLLIRVLGTQDSLPSLTQTYAAVEPTVQALQRIATLADTGESQGVRAAKVVRNVFDLYSAGIDLAQALNSDPAKDTVLAAARLRLRLVSAAIEPLMARQFGLAFARATMLIAEVVPPEDHPRFMTFLGVASSLSQAQTQEQTRDALETAAMPPGGWQGKRYREGGAWITAYPGGAVGYERLVVEGTERAGFDRSGTAVGFSLPIGPEFQLGGPPDSLKISNCHFGVCSMNFFVPLVDLGALLSYRVNQTDNVASAPNTGWSQVFAPGAYISWSLTRRTPLTLLTGVQMLPQLRNVATTGAESAQRTAIRYGVQFSWDVSLWKFGEGRSR